MDSLIQRVGERFSILNEFIEGHKDELEKKIKQNLISKSQLKTEAKQDGKLVYSIYLYRVWSKENV